MTASETNLRARLAAAPLRELADGFYEVLFHALGAECQFIFSAETGEQARAFCATAFGWLSHFEARFSRYLPDSVLSEINRQAGRGWVEVDRECEVLLDLCQHAHFLTKGAFDATALPLSILWDWKRQHDELPSLAEVERAKAAMGWAKVQRAPGRVFLPQPGMMLDFGGVGKEFAVDCLKELGVRHGLPSLLVNLGGDIAVHGDAPEGDGWRVQIEDPLDSTTTFCALRLQSGAAVATSGDYRRCFEFDGRTYGHILDGRTGWPVANGTRAVTVVAQRCVLAGMLSTSAMLTGGREALAMLERTVGVQGCLWHRGELHETRGFRRAVLAREALAAH